jgi:hypothetical protein
LAIRTLESVTFSAHASPSSADILYVRRWTGTNAFISSTSVGAATSNGSVIVLPVHVERGPFAAPVLVISRDGGI